MISLRRLLTLLCLFALTTLPPIVSAQVMFEGKKRGMSFVTSRLGRFQQSNQWDRLDELATNALAEGKKTKNATLLKLGQWYVTLVLGQKGAEPQKVFDSLKQAVDYGYHDVQGIESADQLAIVIGDPTLGPEFKKLVAELKEQIAARAVEKFTNDVNLQFDRAPAISTTPLPLISCINPQTTAPLVTLGRPHIFVLSRTYHEGFANQWPIVSKASQAHADRIGIVALMYGGATTDEFSLQESARYASVVGVDPAVVGVIDRATFKAIRDRLSELHDVLEENAEKKTTFNLFFPCIIVVDAGGRVFFSTSGVLNQTEVESVFTKLAASLPEAPKPDTPAEDEPKKEIKPEDTESKTPEPAKEPEPSPAPEPAKEPAPPKEKEEPTADNGEATTKDADSSKPETPTKEETSDDAKEKEAPEVSPKTAG